MSSHRFYSSCRHPYYVDGHCAEMTCWNYAGKCPRHSPSGDPAQVCLREERIIRIVVTRETEDGRPLLLGTWMPPRDGDEDVVRYFDSGPDEEEKMAPEDCVIVIAVEVAP
jgi:hypothetical protein